jgi:hypothetical protein
MTVRSIRILAVAIMLGPSLAYGSSACMTERAKFPRAHLYWHRSEHCWDDSPGYDSRALAADVRPALIPVRVPSQPKIVGSGIDGGRVTGAQCRYASCE